MKKMFGLFVIFQLLIAIPGCGGGTSGSGLKTYYGKVSNTYGSPIAGVVVTIESTGDSAITDSDGQFLIPSQAEGQEVVFFLNSPQFSNRFALRSVGNKGARVNLDITVDTATDLVQVSHVSLRAWFAGICDRFFENREIIRQSNQVPPGTTCSINVEVLGDGRRLANIPVALQFTGCEPESKWHTLVNASTGSGKHAGATEINFKYVDSPEYCRYRVFIDLPTSRTASVTYPIDTFTEQEIYREKRDGQHKKLEGG